MRGDFEKQAGVEVGAFLRRLRRSLGWTLEDVVERVARQGVEITTSTLSRAERGIASLSPGALVAVLDALGSSLDQIEDVIRAARARRQPRLGEETFEDLFAAAREAARRGETVRARDLLQAAEDRALLVEGSPPPPAVLRELRLWLATACAKLDQTGLARRYALGVLNERGVGPDEIGRALVVLPIVASHERDDFTGSVLVRELDRVAERMTGAVRSWAQYQIGLFATRTGDFEQAVARLEAAREGYAADGRDVESLRSSLSLGYALARSGKVSRGRRMIETTLRFATRKKNPELYTWGHWQLGRLAFHLDDPDLGARELRDAALTARARGLRSTEFAIWYELWCLESEVGRHKHAAAIERTLKRVLKRVGHQIPEAKRFVIELQRRDRAAGETR